ncbi:MAG: B12-binding domain-containing radical SAM protein [Bacteroidales bacterium]
MAHPKGAHARVLLSSVFGPFACDDEFGSRAINPVELYHNQVTREQGPFSLRMFHRSWGISLIQHNIPAPSTVLDFPTRESFVAELQAGDYDVVGISSIIVNVGKVREMCRLVRQHSPKSKVIVGGHVAAIDGLDQMIDADEIVKGDGISWFRDYLGTSPEAPIVHPPLKSSFGFRVMGLPQVSGGGNPAATIIPSVGCPLGCNFCTTSSFFGGKGKVVTFYEKGEDVFRICCEAEAALGVKTFFIMDENFLLFRKRAMELLDCMKRHDKAWTFFVFSSANAIAKYDISELVDLGIVWIWLGLESPNSSYAKLNGTDTQALVREVQRHGIRVHGSSIIGLEHHTPANIRQEIEYAVAHDADCHQFMLYTPVPGTPLFQEVQRQGRLLDVDLADIHGQYKFNFQHPAISRDDSKAWLDSAFRLDYERNGPSLYRMMRTMYEGWKQHRDHQDPRVRRRFNLEAAQLKTGYVAALYAMEKYLRDTNAQVAERIRELRAEIQRDMGIMSSAISHLAGPMALWASRLEAWRFPNGRTMEPEAFIDRRNWPDGAPAKA